MDEDPPPEEHEPDVRFTYANERTFLAWNRTALALIATGVAATQLLPEFHVAGGRRILGLPLIALGALVAVTSFLHWQANQRAMRRDQPLPRSPMPLVLSVGVGVVAVIALVLATLGPK
ncbi:MAG: YidH family protein [Acidimicrobiales bacterium]